MAHRMPDAGNPHVLFDERDVESQYGASLRYCQMKGNSGKQPES